MQRRDYPLLLQPDGVCGAGVQDEKESPLLLLAIKSTELNFKNRCHSTDMGPGRMGSWTEEKQQWWRVRPQDLFAGQGKY
ncbi:hypothetical protein CesoFtcFv8_010522 [Champsocephalus esox]|uniref:Uncharacterized protein n=1 Tax=Champsocephalus esox TaxID=159716 RepID=A0AAN8C527_9TELE|nr:hypothetical protein CesoFtcFv8_010522 [Champsocephalus esox]